MQLVFVADTTLFHVAAEQLGDATQWYRIAALNSINDPVLRGVVQLLLPTYDPSATGGLPGQ